MKSKVIGTLLLAALATGLVYVSTHHRVYGHCHIELDGTKVCHLLRWEGNK